MTNFTLNTVPSIVSAPGALGGLVERLAEHGVQGPVLVVMDPALTSRGLDQQVAAALKARSLDSVVSTLPPGEPKEAYIRAAAAQAKPLASDAVVCIGGGSALDAGKLIACLLETDADVANFRLAAKPLPRRNGTLVCVPTTAGTGSEATTTSIVSDERGVKYWYWSRSIMPDCIILDPELTFALPRAVTAATGMDALAHAIEAATNRKATSACSLYSRHAIECVTEHLATAVNEPENLIARAGMQKAAAFAGVAIENSGTCLAHAIGHALGSLAGMPHGRAVTVGLCASLSWSMEGEEAAFEDVAEAMGLADVRMLPDAVLRLALEVGVDLKVDAAAYDLSAESIAQQILEPENLPMVQASRRPATLEDCRLLATRALELAHEAPTARVA